MTCRRVSRNRAMPALRQRESIVLSALVSSESFDVYSYGAAADDACHCMTAMADAEMDVFVIP